MWKIRIILENVKIKSIFSVSLLMFAAPSFFNYVTNGISYFGNCETASRKCPCGQICFRSPRSNRARPPFQNICRILKSVPKGKIYTAAFTEKNMGLKVGDKITVEIEGVSRLEALSGSPTRVILDWDI